MVAVEGGPIQGSNEVAAIPGDFFGNLRGKLKEEEADCDGCFF